MSSSVWTLLQQPSDHLDRFVLWRALPGCCVATSLVACPGSSIARELIPWGGGIGGDTAALLLGLKLYKSFPFLHRYITLIAGSHHLISQAGWNRCNLSIYLSILQSQITDASLACFPGSCVCVFLLDNVAMWRMLHPYFIAAAFSLIWICQGMSWQHLHQPCVAGKL